MKKFFSVASALAVPVVASGLLACDPPIEPTTSVRNNLVDDSTDPPTPIAIDSIQVRFLGEQDEDIEGPAGGGFDTLGPIQPPSVGGACAADAECGEGSCVEGTCVTPVDTSISELECGTYDVIFTNANGECSFVLEEFDQRYRGEGLYICFVQGRWDLDTHIGSSNCPDLFPM